MASFVADVIVVGYGAAGAAAALALADHGASALIVEKQPPGAHTPNVRLSGGLIMGVNDAEPAGSYLHACGGGMVPEDVCRTWAERALGLAHWLDDHGLELDLVRIGGGEQQDLDGAGAVEVLQQGGAVRDASGVADTAVAAAGFRTGQEDARRGFTGITLFERLSVAVTSKPTIDVRWSSPALRLTRNTAGAVDGVIVADGNGTTALTARHGVILACGGFGNDEHLKLNYLKAAPIYFYGNTGNTGDGVRMAQAVGADLWHMNQMIGRAIGHFPMAGSHLDVSVWLDPPPYVITDKHGRRYANEYAQAKMKHGFYYEMLPYAPDEHSYPRIPSYWFFDERRRSSGPLVSTISGPVGVGRYDWSEDNRKEIDAEWIHVGGSIAEVARRAGVIDPDQAERTIRAFNEQCPNGPDSHGRPADTLLPLDEPPYYCVPLFPGGSNTCGGPRRDSSACVLNSFGERIEGLYAAGELGGTLGLLYPADGANLSDAFCFGQIAAESALTTAP